MKHKSIISIYCIKSDCTKILNTNRCRKNLHFEPHILRQSVSYKKIQSYQNAEYKLRQGDYIVVIEHPPHLIVKENINRPNTLVFCSLAAFNNWLHETFGALA